MKKLFFLLLSLCAYADEQSIQAYFDFIEKYPGYVAEIGDASQGEIEIILDREKMLSIEQSMGRKVGMICSDSFWTWINDACKFPSGKTGVYGRILHTKSEGKIDQVGAIVMPILPNGKIALNCNYRHATRSWEIELPRGGTEKGETEEEAALRETQEETGMIADRVLLLGRINPDSGVQASVVPIYAAFVAEQGDADREDSEAIEEILALSVGEIKEAFMRGFHECEVRGQMRKVHFRDPFLASAVLFYELKTK